MPFPKQVNASLFTLMIKMQGIYWIIGEWETSFRWTINEWPWWIRSLNQTSNVNDKISELYPTDIPNSSNSIYHCIFEPPRSIQSKQIASLPFSNELQKNGLIPSSKLFLICRQWMSLRTCVFYYALLIIKLLQVNIGMCFSLNVIM